MVIQKNKDTDNIGSNDIVNIFGIDSYEQRKIIRILLNRLVTAEEEIKKLKEEVFKQT